MKFANREKELATLESEYKSDRFSFTVIYGRRRVGKTRLIREFIRDKHSLYFLADTGTENLNMERFRNIAAELLNDQLLKQIDFSDWQSLVKYVVTHTGKEKKLIIVIDEFQYLVKINPAIPSVFQSVVDEILQRENCMLILCGSIISLMYKATLGYDSPLYGRRTSQIKLQALSFDDFQLLFKKVSQVRCLEFYGMLSGIPKYIELFEPHSDIYKSIEKNFLDPNRFFYQEPRFLLNEEVSSNKTYFSILQIIAEGSHKLGEIASRMGVKTQNITSFLNTLRDLEIIEREVPIFEANPEKSRKGLYFFKDYFLKFWFKFIFPFSSYLEMGHTSWVLSSIRNSFNEYTSLVFEKTAQEIIMKNPPFPILKIGRFWDKDLEIDLVAIGKTEILFGECKWSNQKVGGNILRDLKKKVSHLRFKELENKTINYALFSKKGFTRAVMEMKDKKTHLISLS